MTFLWSSVLKRSPRKTRLLSKHELEDQQPGDRKTATSAAPEEDSVAALDVLPDDMLLQIIAACSDGHLALPELDAVSGLGCLCKDVLQQLQRLRPVVQVSRVACSQFKAARRSSLYVSSCLSNL